MNQAFQHDDGADDGLISALYPLWRKTYYRLLQARWALEKHFTHRSIGMELRRKFQLK